MRCVIVGEAVKLFARAIHCLAKIGDEIYFEPLKKGLSLRTVNSSRSAYACCIFKKSFFQTYDDGVSDDQDSPNEGFKCKLSMKSCLTVFKSLSTIDRVVDQCLIKMNDQEEQLTFLLYCRHGITKTYNLSYQDCESLQAIFTKDLSPNMINVDPHILNDVVVNFQNAHEEISFTVCPQNMVVTNYIDEDEDLARVIKTKMVLVADEFEKFQIGVDTEVTFCLKELKGIITFADSSGQNLNINFESAGKPIVFSLANDPTFEANFVLATLMDLPGEQTSQQTNKQTEKPKKASKQSKKQSKSPAHSQPQQDDEFGLDADEDWTDEVIAIENQLAQETLTRNNGKKHPDFEDSFPGKASTSSQAQTLRTSRSAKCIQSPPLSVPSDLERAEMPGSMSVDSEKSPGIAVRSGRDKIMQQKQGQKHSGRVLVDGDRSQDSVPGTPPSKKFKSMFFSAMSGKKHKTTIEQQPNKTVILVEDSDVESD